VRPTRGTERDTGEALFLQHLETIERAIQQACRRGAIPGDDGEDFASYVRLKLIEKDYAIIRKYDQRSSFAAFISIVVQRLLLDYRIAHWGKWHASNEAKRLGEVAIVIEAMLYRDGRTLDEVVPTLLRRWPELTRAAIDDVVQRLPPRMPRCRTVQLDEDVVETLAANDEFGDDAERAVVAERIASIVRSVMNAADARDRLIFRLQFEGEMSVADISRTLKIEQKPLYRRLKRLLATLRARLEAAGVTAADAEDVLASRGIHLDFGLTSTEDDSESSSRSGDDA
jgi:RNA polymerase sigma factor (sigma-70 family)